MVELNLYVFVCCDSMSRHFGYAHCIDLHVLLVIVYIFLSCNKKLSYLPQSLDNTTRLSCLVSYLESYIVILLSHGIISDQMQASLSNSCLA